jgi:hypothetical protein
VRVCSVTVHLRPFRERLQPLSGIRCASQPIRNLYTYLTTGLSGIAQPCVIGTRTQRDRSGASGAFLSRVERRIARHPVSQSGREPGLRGCCDHVRVVIDEDHDVFSQVAQRPDLHDPCRSVIAGPSHEQRPGGESLPGQPVTGQRPHPIRTARQPHDVVIGCHRLDEIDALGQACIGIGMVEEGWPVLRTVLDVMEPVPHVCDNPVDVEDRDAHAEHPTARPGRASLPHG